MRGHFFEEVFEQLSCWVTLIYFPEVALVLVGEPLVVGVVELGAAEGTQLRGQNK